MSVDSEQRGFPRYLAVSLPILIDAPSLSDFSLDPIDVSLGGFKVVVSERPAVGDHIECSVEINDKLFEECHGRVARVIENEADPSTWYVGMSLLPPVDQRINYEKAIKRFIVV